MRVYLYTRTSQYGFHWGASAESKVRDSPEPKCDAVMEKWDDAWSLTLLSLELTWDYLWTDLSEMSALNKDAQPFRWNISIREMKLDEKKQDRRNTLMWVMRNPIVLYLFNNQTPWLPCLQTRCNNQLTL